MRKAVRGFTLIELMVVVTLAAILGTIGIPSFRSFIAGQRVKTANSDFALAAVYARSEAIKRNGEVKIVAATGGWANGWNVTVTTGGAVISTQGAYTGLTFTPTPNTLTEVPYSGTGRLGITSAPTLTVTAAGSTSKRCVSFELSGLPKSKLDGSCP